jgi:3-hydroxyisobutyrate dehydrogenase
MDIKVAFIGVGIMGQGLVKNLKKKEVPLHLYSRDIKKIKHLEDGKTKIFDSISDTIKDTKIIILCLTEDSIVEDIFFNQGILKHSNTLILDFGTTSPELTKKMHKAASEKGIRFFDCPMTGSKIAAEGGEIVFMFGGKEEDAQDVRFILETCGKKTFYCAEVGKGQEMKIALNMVQAGLMQVYMEGFVLAHKLGLDAKLFQELISNSAAKSGISEFKLNYILNQDYSTNFSLKNMNKDLHHALNLMHQTNSALPLTSTLKSIYNAGMSANLGEEDFCSLFKINEKLNNTIA